MKYELRIGNWLYDFTRKKYVLLTGVNENSLNGSDALDLYEYADLKPIKITKANSEGFNIAKLKNIIDVLQIVQSAPLVVPEVFYLVMQLAGKLAIKIEYVHQLQNLYMDITQEYLEWNPEKQRSKLHVV